MKHNFGEIQRGFAKILSLLFNTVQCAVAITRTRFVSPPLAKVGEGERGRGGGEGGGFEGGKVNRRNVKSFVNAPANRNDDTLKFSFHCIILPRLVGSKSDLWLSLFHLIKN